MSGSESGSTASGTILVAIDGSHNSLLAAGVGARLATQLGAHLGLVHVLDVPTLSFWVGVEARMKDDIRAQAEKTLTEISTRIHEVCDIVPEFYIVEGAPELEIVRIAKADPKVIMVIAGRNGIATEKSSHLRLRRGMGRLTSKLSEQLPVPVMVVPPDIPETHICAAMAEFRTPDTAGQNDNSNNNG